MNLRAFLTFIFLRRISIELFEFVILASGRVERGCGVEFLISQTAKGHDANLLYNALPKVFRSDNPRGNRLSPPRQIPIEMQI
ncbi:hypothetical protein BV98_000001 [Sphingobium herbicidovorans NBRC 16415]|uniref:Uncharacterized protein n=1 Tax=Sphingobium herbicidovorans (strain ATCC 700291 / DSM 11019 / CCUG 56400 / KCTC 2939 / LMG 18315 / NBRC 16415 / MH) TaxID=1219045 RepID=A0A086PED6_SPHHM|nr:hypothetical protein BV98_000001 [Sphingobium herbicidovorans NBRC 16415]